MIILILFLIILYLVVGFFATALLDRLERITRNKYFWRSDKTEDMFAGAILWPILLLMMIPRIGSYYVIKKFPKINSSPFQNS